MALLSLEDTLKKDNMSALVRISHALRYLVEEFKEVEVMLGSGCVVEAHQSCSHDGHSIDASPEFLGVVATITKQPSGFVGTVPSGRGTEVHSRTVRRTVTCRHSCNLHPELMDSDLWSKLPEELVQLVFARLPLDKIFDLCAQSSAWSTMSRTSNFRGVCSERHPKLLGFVGPGADERVWNTMYDIKSNKWIRLEVRGFPLTDDLRPRYFASSLVACDGGLLCLVPMTDLSCTPILVCNPLTDEWRVLPCLPYYCNIDIKLGFILKLVMEEDLTGYKVILVDTQAFDGPCAYYYDSKTGVWSCMESGMVFGFRSIGYIQDLYPFVFDCTTKTMYECSDLRGSKFAMVKDRVFGLELLDECEDSLIVSEYTWESSLGKLKKISSTEPSSQFHGGGYLFVFEESLDADDRHHCFIHLYDLSADEWHRLPMGDEFSFSSNELSDLTLCELRWDAVP